MNDFLDKFNTPELAKRMIIHLFYFVVWPVGLFFCFSLLLPVYVSVVLTAWLTYWIPQVINEEDKKRIDPPAPIQIFLSKKIVPIDSARTQSDE